MAAKAWRALESRGAAGPVCSGAVTASLATTLLLLSLNVGPLPGVLAAVASIPGLAWSYRRAPFQVIARLAGAGYVAAIVLVAAIPKLLSGHTFEALDLAARALGASLSAANILSLVGWRGLLLGAKAPSKTVAILEAYTAWAAGTVARIGVALAAWRSRNLSDGKSLWGAIAATADILSWSAWRAPLASAAARSRNLSDLDDSHSCIGASTKITALAVLPLLASIAGLVLSRVAAPPPH